jgi:hypothetical protein
MLPSQAASLLPLLASSTGLAHPAPQHATPTWAACVAGTGRWSPLGNGSGAQLVREVSTGLCLAYPGTVPVSGWGPPLVLVGCNSSDAAQHWAFQGGELRYLGAYNTAAAARGPVCVQAFGKRPYDRPMPAACWPCVPHSWPELIRQVTPPAARGIGATARDAPAVWLQLDMSPGGGSKVCLSAGSVTVRRRPCFRATLSAAAVSFPPQLNTPHFDRPCCVGAAGASGCSPPGSQPPPSPPPRAPATPTAQQLAWQDLEHGALFQFNIGEYGSEDNDYACANAQISMPSPKMFQPQRLNATAWMASVKASGGKYAILT